MNASVAAAARSIAARRDGASGPNAPHTTRFSMGSYSQIPASRLPSKTAW